MKTLMIFLMTLILLSYSEISAKPGIFTKPLKLQYYEFENGLQFLKLGNTWREAGNYDKAKYYLDKGYNIIKDYNSEYWKAVAYEYYGYYYKDIDEKETALDYLNGAYKIYKRLITLRDGSPAAVKKVIIEIENSEEIEQPEKGSTGYEPVPGPEPGPEPEPELTVNNKSTNDLEKRLSKLENRVDNLEERIEEVSKEINGIQGSLNTIIDLLKPNPKPYEETTRKERGKSISMLGVGFGSTYGIGDMRFPPISISMNYRVSENYEIGLFLGYSSELYQNIKFDYRIVGLRLLYRMWKGDDWDISTSLMVGYNSLSANAPLTGLNVSQEKILYGGIVDFRYLFTQNIGVFLETGYGLTYASGGVVFNF